MIKKFSDESTRLNSGSEENDIYQENVSTATTDLSSAMSDDACTISNTSSREATYSPRNINKDIDDKK